MLPLFDMHTHTKFSHDSETEPRDACLAALGKVAGAALTDHVDISRIGIVPMREKLEASRRIADLLDREFAPRGLRVLMGAEIGEGSWDRKTAAFYETLTDYDVVIGSAHCVRLPSEKDEAYSRIDFSGWTDEEMQDYLRAYWKEENDLLDTCDFDILAHLPGPLRYFNGKYHRNLDLSEHADAIDGILEKTVSRGISLEINTSGRGADFGAFLPDREILQRYFALGGRRITLGSDTHQPKNYGAYFEEACAMMKEIGFTGTYYYEKRKAVFLPF